jgi:cytochrome bd ubiquinol oxidase subunit I
MFGLEALDLARIQFAFTISFHILFPAITIGLASYLAVLEGLWLKTHNDTYRDLYHFWSKIFAVNFGMGWSRAWSWPISSVPTGVVSRTSPAPSRGPC